MRPTEGGRTREAGSKGFEVHPSAIVYPGARLAEGVSIGPFAIVGPHVTLGPGTTVGPYAILDGWTTIGRGNRIGAGAIIGNEPQDLKFRGERTDLIIGDDNIFGEFVTISRGTAHGRGETRIGSRCVLAAYAHVGHDCQLGDGVRLGEAAGLSGHVSVEDHAVVGNLAGIHQFTKIGRFAAVGAHSMVNKDVPPFVVVNGAPARVQGVNQAGLRQAGVPRRVREEIKRAFHILYHAGLTVAAAIAQMEQELPGSEEIDHFIRFLRNADRGICR